MNDYGHGTFTYEATRHARRTRSSHRRCAALSRSARWTVMLCHVIFRWRFKQDVLDLVFFAAVHRGCREVGY